MFGLYYCAKTYNRFLKILLLACLLITFCDTSNAKKIQTALYGRVYLQSGDSIIADGDLRVGIPLKNKNLEIIEKAYTRDSGSILRWDVYESSGGQNSVSYLVPAIGVKFKGAPAAFIIKANGKFNDWYISYWLKKNYPELKEAWEKYYHKGKDAKAHRQELVDNPSTALLFYEEFLRNNPPIEEKVIDKKNKKDKKDKKK